MKSLKKIKATREEVGQLDKNVKDANREIAKWEFYETIKNKLEQEITFLNILPPPIARDVKLVYHPIFAEVVVINTKFHQKYFEEVKGKIIVNCDFPLSLSV